MSRSGSREIETKWVASRTAGGSARCTDTWLEVRVGQDSRGRIVAQVSNPTPRDIGQIVLLIQYQDTTGKAQQLRRSLNARVAGGSQQLFDLGLTVKLTQEQTKTLQAGVAGAQVVN